MGLILKLLLIFVLVPSSAKALNLNTFWASSGGYKLARQDLLPNGTCSTCTITRNWDGTTIKLFGAKNETVSGVLYLGNGGAVDSSSTSVTISSFTGPNGSGITASPVTCAGTTNYTTRPYELFVSSYLQILGMTTLSWDPTEYEERDLPQRFRRPCTVNGSGTCTPDGGTLWTNRPDYGKFYPDALVPMECHPTFNVAKSSSQAVWLDVFISTTLTGNATYTANITVKEGVTVSTIIPVALYVYNFTLPDTPSLVALIEMSGYDINYRHQGEHFPNCIEPFTTTRNNYAKYFHRHKFAATAGDSGPNYCCQTGKNYPCPEYISRLNGSLYSAAQGYANAPGLGVGDQIYSIGTYGQWAHANWSTHTLGGATGFDVNVSSWGSYFKDNFPSVRSFIYLTDEPASLVSTEKWATWMSTVPTSQVSGYTVQSFVTASALSTSISAPHVTMPATTFTVGNTSTWTALASQYQTVGSTQMWMYNSHPPAVGSVYATEDDGIAPTSIFWAMWKKGIQGWFFWQATNWGNPGNQSPEENNLFHVAKTFGFATSSDTVKGETGFNYANGDGVLVYPGTETLFTADSYGIDGPIGSWRLKMLRRGIQDGDYLTLAYAINPGATQSIVDDLIPEVLWENDCFDHGDCTYSYGGRSWTNDPDAWELSREALADIINGEPFSSSRVRGGVRFTGGVTLK